MSPALVSDEGIACASDGTRVRESSATYSDGATIGSACYIGCFDEGEAENAAAEHDNGEKAYSSGAASLNIAADDHLRVEAAQVDRIGRYEPKLSENGIPEDVLDKLLPGDEILDLDEPTVAGSLAYCFFKRAFDLVSCSLALVVLAIPMMIIAVKIKTESPGPAIYAQRRVGKDGEIFNVYKFRSMYVDAEAKGARWAQGDDPRITPFGKFMRQKRLASVIIGTPGDGESTKSLSRSAKSSLDLQLCERRPGLCCIAGFIITYLSFLSLAFFGGQVSALKRRLQAFDVVSDGRVCAVAQMACAAVPLAEDWTVAA